VRGSHVAYEHPSGALLRFPPHRTKEKVDKMTEIVIRKTLDEFSLMEREQFEELWHKQCL
jgi:hypothetical protein